MPKSKLIGIYINKRHRFKRSLNDTMFQSNRKFKSSIQSKFLCAAILICLFILVSDTSSLVAAFLTSQISGNLSSSSNQQAAHGNMSNIMMSRGSQTLMTNTSLQSGNSILVNNNYTTSKTGSSNSNANVKAQAQNAQEIQAPKVGPTNSPAFNSRLKQQIQLSSQPVSRQQVEGTKNFQRLKSDNHMAATDSQENHSFMSINSAPTTVSDPQKREKMEAQKVMLSELTSSAGSTKSSSVNVQQQMSKLNKHLPWQAQSSVTSSMWNMQPTRSSSTYLQQLDPNIQQQQQQQRLISSPAQEQVNELLEPMQLEKPTGYSYESSLSGNAYTHTSPLSPARQEVLLAEQAGLKQRARQQVALTNYHDRSAHSIFDLSPRFVSPSSGTQSEQYASKSATETKAPQTSQSNYNTHNSPLTPQHHITSNSMTGYSMMPAPHQTITGTAVNPCKPTHGLQPLVQELSQTNIQINEIGNGLVSTPLAVPNFSNSGPPKYQRVSDGTRLRSQYIFKVIRADSLTDCESACSRASALAANNPHETCRSFNYRAYFAAENCELSRHDIRMLKLEDSAQFEQHTQFDFYALDSSSLATNQQLMLSPSSNSLVYGPFPEPDCLDVSQSCSQDGLEFTLRTNEPFNGRIYTYGFYDSCFFDGEGATTSVLRISRSNGFPRCGTQQFGDLMTNIVVVQFNDYVQTTRDKKYNLTCYFSGPGEAVVTSNYLDTKIDERSHPMQIEHLPPQNVITSNVHLRVLYRGQPTNTIAVGDLLTFRLETKSLQPQPQQQQQYRASLTGESGLGKSEIFATNVIAKDPYSGRQVQLIDSRGCPIDPVNVFPELQRTPDGALESEFYAFKIPDSNFLIFQATVRTCKSPCEPVICQHPTSLHNEPQRAQYIAQTSTAGSGVKGGSVMSSYLLHSPHSQSHLSSVPSWGKRRRRSIPEANAAAAIADDEDEMYANAMESVEHIIPVRFSPATDHSSDGSINKQQQVRSLRRPELTESEEEVKEMFRVYMSRAEINRNQQRERQVSHVHEEPEKLSIAEESNSSSSSSSSLIRENNDQYLNASASSSQQELEDRVREQICMSLSGYYVMLFAVISLSMIMVSVMFISLFVTRRAKFRISNSIAESII